jgi:hypothetical protein
MIKPVKLATLLSQPLSQLATLLQNQQSPMMLYSIITPELSHLFILYRGHSFTFSAMLSVQAEPLYVGRLKELYSFCAVVYMDQNCHLLAELPVVCPTSMLPPEV